MKGIWSTLDGEFAETGLYDQAEADEALERWRGEYAAADCDPDDLVIYDICPEHDESPKDGCAVCEEEEDEE